MKNKDFTIGILGGMGTYATIYQFQQYAAIFPAEKEWDRPRLIIDNRCTMPSRVRAFLYNENREKLVDEMAESMSMLIDAGCTRIILACNTSHIFLPEIYKKLPSLELCVVNIIDACVETVKNECVNEVYLLASEGTIKAKIFQERLRKVNISCNIPSDDDLFMLRECIEAVKQNKYTDQTRLFFLDLINRSSACILGCTELPILYEKYVDGVNCKKVYDPMYLGLLKIREEYSHG